MDYKQYNSIFSQLPQQDLERLSPHLKLLSLKKGEILVEPGNSLDHYYFPISCSLELSIEMADGKCGAITVADTIYPVHMIGDAHHFHRTTVHHSGLCYRIPAWVIHEELRQSKSLLWLVLQETVKMFKMTAVDSVCIRNHTLEQITAKLILMSIDDSQGQVTDITHQEIANSLGTRREGVTIVFGKFKAKHLIATKRGSVELLNREGLEHVACECYKTLQQIKHPYRKKITN
jgi:CRP-like cAMP-binding protein